jgi:hypothetical protein
VSIKFPCKAPGDKVHWSNFCSLNLVPRSLTLILLDPLYNECRAVFVNYKVCVEFSGSGPDVVRICGHGEHHFLEILGQSLHEKHLFQCSCPQCPCPQCPQIILRWPFTTFTKCYQHFPILFSGIERWILDMNVYSFINDLVSFLTSLFFFQFSFSLLFLSFLITVQQC